MILKQGFLQAAKLDILPTPPPDRGMGFFEGVKIKW